MANRRAALAANAAFWVLCVSTSGVAAAAPAGAAASSNATQLTEIIVTARRIEENIQTVPITVQAFSSQALREANVSQVRELMYVTPGLLTTGSGALANQNYVLRDQGNTGQQGHGIPGVMSYFDDVPLPINAQSQPQFDLSSIQVLKGPQGTLFGRNTVGGAVLVYSRKPDFTDVNGYLEATGGSYAWWGLEGAVNVPIVADKLAVRIAARTERRDGYVENLSHTGDGGDLDNSSVRVQLRWDPTNNISNVAMYDYFRSSDHENGVVNVFSDNGEPISPRLFSFPNVFSPPPPFSIPLGTIGTGSFYKTMGGPLVPNGYIRQWGVTDHLNVDLKSVQFTNIFAYRENRYDAVGPDDGVDWQVLKVEQRTNEAQWTEEAQFRGKLLEDRVNWILGGFYYKSDPITGNVGQNIILPILVPSPPQASYPFYASESKAIYGHTDIAIGELLKGLSLELGYRYTWDRYSLCTATAGLNSPFNAPVGSPFSAFNLSPDQCRDPAALIASGALAAASSASNTSSAPGWTLGLNWQANDNLFTYVTTRRGYRAGQLNGPAFSPTSPLAMEGLQTLQPEETTDYEIGIKSNFDLGGMPVQFNVAAFHSKTKNTQRAVTQVSQSQYDQLSAPGFLILAGGGTLAAAQAAQTAAGFGPAPGGGIWIPCAAAPITGTNYSGVCNSPTTDPSQTIVNYNAGERTVDGLEVQLVAKPVSSLTLSAAASFYSPKLSTSLADIPDAIRPYVLAAGSSDPANGSPKDTVSAGLHWNLPLPTDERGKLAFTTNYYYSSKFIIIGANYVQPAFSLVNMRLDWTGALGTPVDVSLFINNVFDKKYAVAAGNFPGQLASIFPAALWSAIGDPGMAELSSRGVASIIPGPPRMFGVQVRYSFGK